MTDTSGRPALVAGGWDWQAHAACQGMSAATFFTADNERGPTKRRHEAQAKAVCAGCPVLGRCRDWALAMREPYGVWGGTTPEERAILLSQRSVAAPDRREPAHVVAVEGYR
jgi:WhiB family redox-sensing transcriptional regulator